MSICTLRVYGSMRICTCLYTSEAFPKADYPNPLLYKALFFIIHCVYSYIGCNFDLLKSIGMQSVTVPSNMVSNLLTLMALSK